MKKYQTIPIIFNIMLLYSSAYADSLSMLSDSNDNKFVKGCFSVEDTNGLTIYYPPAVKPESLDLSVDKGNYKSGIQSLVFARNMPIVDALQFLAVKYNKNIIYSSKVSGTLSFTKLNNVSFEEAISAILGTNFRYQNHGNVFMVYSIDEYQKISPQEDDMVAQVFTLYYISAAEAKKMVSPVISKDGKMETVSPAETGVPSGKTIGAQNGGGDAVAINDMIVIYDYPERIARAEKIIAAIDIRPKQVLIEAAILTATLTNSTQLGVDWRIRSQSFVSSIGELSKDFIGFNGSSTSIESGATTDGVTIGIVKGDVSAFIRALETITDVTLLANPRILAANKQLGQVYIGTKIAYQSQTTQNDTSTTQQVQFLDTGTKLAFRPYIGNDGYIRMDIHPKDSSANLRTSGAATLPDETSAELSTNIIVKDGETVIIGGLFRDRVQTSKTQVPILGNLPIIGALFSSNADQVKREEVIVLLTPYIISEPNQTRGGQKAIDIKRKINGARQELHPANRMRLAQEHYEDAVTYYHNGKKQDAMEALKDALELYPAYEEAIELKEKIQNELNSTKKQPGK